MARFLPSTRCRVPRRPQTPAPPVGLIYETYLPAAGRRVSTLNRPVLVSGANVGKRRRTSPFRGSVVVPRTAGIGATSAVGAPVGEGRASTHSRRSTL